VRSKLQDLNCFCVNTLFYIRALKSNGVPYNPDVFKVSANQANVISSHLGAEISLAFPSSKPSHRPEISRKALTLRQSLHRKIVAVTFSTDSLRFQDGVWRIDGRSPFAQTSLQLAPGQRLQALRSALSERKVRSLNPQNLICPNERPARRGYRKRSPSQAMRGTRRPNQKLLRETGQLTRAGRPQHLLTIKSNILLSWLLPTFFRVELQ
jgi:hypothetical protein